MFKPFARQAQVWEEHTLELRRKLKLQIFDLLEPEMLATEVGLLVVDAHEICALLDSDTAAQILKTQILKTSKDSWSGGVYATPLPTGELICMINPTHRVYRQKITLMEEIAHIHLKHTPTGLRSVGNGLRLRDFNAKQEREAYGVGCAGLLPWGAFFTTSMLAFP
jgi:hypothetical protein